MNWRNLIRDDKFFSDVRNARKVQPRGGSYMRSHLILNAKMNEKLDIDAD